MIDGLCGTAQACVSAAPKTSPSATIKAATSGYGGTAAKSSTQATTQTKKVQSDRGQHRQKTVPIEGQRVPAPGWDDWTNAQRKSWMEGQMGAPRMSGRFGAEARAMSLDAWRGLANFSTGFVDQTTSALTLGRYSTDFGPAYTGSRYTLSYATGAVAAEANLVLGDIALGMGARTAVGTAVTRGGAAVGSLPSKVRAVPAAVRAVGAKARSGVSEVGAGLRRLGTMLADETGAIGRRADGASNGPMRLPVSETWGRPDTLAAHFRDHGGDFAARNADEYARMASAFFQRSLRSGVPTKIDPKTGVIRIYDPAANAFGSFNPTGTTRTFFKPDPARHGYPTNWDYWLRQPGYSP